MAGLLAVLAVAGCGGGSATPRGVRVLNTPRPFASDQRAEVGHVASAHAAGTVVASLGFDPARDGFSFENYGFIAGLEINQHVMRELFGDAVCVGDVASDSCTLTPSAQSWAQQMEDSMQGGHCFGFSMTALRFFKHDLDPSDFGGSTTYSLSLSAALESEVAYGWLMQLLPAEQSAALAGTPADELAFLKQAFANPGDVYTLSMQNSYGAHGVTPIAVEDLGGGQDQIDVYDNNYPGVTRAISVDTNSDSWSYNGAANPSDHTALYQGQGHSNPMVLWPLSPGLRQGPWPCCGAKSALAAGRATVLVSLAGNPVEHGHLLITTPDGRRLGYAHGRFVDQIKGAHVVRPILSQDYRARPEPLYEVPAGTSLRVTLDGSGATGHDAAAVHVTGPGFGATVANLKPDSGSSDQLVIAPGGRGLSLMRTGSHVAPAPVMRLGVDHGAGGSELIAKPKTLGSGQRLTLTLQPVANKVSVRSAGAQQVPVALTLTLLAPSGNHTANNSAVTVGPGQSAILNLGLEKIG